MSLLKTLPDPMNLPVPCFWGSGWLGARISLVPQGALPSWRGLSNVGAEAAPGTEQLGLQHLGFEIRFH